jgi:hypothetical protein
MITEEHIRNIRITKQEVTWGGVQLGLTVEGSANLELTAAVTEDSDATELEGTVAMIERAIVPGFSCEFKRADFMFLFLTLLQGRVNTYTDGTNYVFHLGNKNRNLHDDLNEVLDLHPAGVALTDKSNHVRIWKTAMVIDKLSLISSREKTRRIWRRGCRRSHDWKGKIPVAGQSWTIGRGSRRALIKTKCRLGRSLALPRRVHRRSAKIRASVSVIMPSWLVSHWRTASLKV